MRTINAFILLCVFCLFCQPTLAQRRVRLADSPPFERAVVVVKYFEGLHGWKNYPYIGYGHQLQRGEHFTANITVRQADSLLRADLWKCFEHFKGYGKDAKALAREVNKALRYYKKMGLLHSITTDNGSEFAKFKTIERSLKTPVYFAPPYQSWDKPHIEYLNKLLRQFIPKSSTFEDLTDLDLRRFQNPLNNRPRKKLNYKTPNEVIKNIILEKLH